MSNRRLTKEVRDLAALIFALRVADNPNLDSDHLASETHVAIFDAEAFEENWGAVKREEAISPAMRALINRRKSEQ